MPRTHKFTHGNPLRALVSHLPQSWYARRVSHTPDGRRRDDCGFRRPATLHNLGEVTIVRSKKRRNDGPKGVKRLVTNLTEANAGAMLSISAWRWGVEVTIKARKSDLPLGQRQVTAESERVERSV